MKYVKLDSENIVREVIPEIDPEFPGVLVEQRYAPKFLAECIKVEDGIETPHCWIWQDGEFVPPPEPEPEEEPEAIEELESMEEPEEAIEGEEHPASTDEDYQG